MTTEKNVYYPTWKDENDNQFILEAEKFMWPSEEIAEKMGNLVDPKALGTDVTYAGVVNFPELEDGHILMHHVDGVFVSPSTGKRINVSFIAGPILKKKCGCNLH